MLGDLEQLLGRGRSEARAATAARKRGTDGGRPRPQAGRGRDVEGALARTRGRRPGASRRPTGRAARAGIGPSFPILGYDDLTAAQVQGRLEGLTPAELRKVRDYEKRNANRKSVLNSIESKLELARLRP